MRDRRKGWGLAAMLSIWAAVPLFADESLVLLPAGPAIVRADTAALVLSGQRGGSIPVAARVVSAAGGTELLLAALDGGALLERADGTRLSVAVFVYTLGSENETLAHANQRFEIDLETHREALGTNGLRIAVALEPLAGEHEVRFLLRSPEAFGLASVTVDPSALERTAELGDVAELPAGSWHAAVGRDEASSSWPELLASSSPERKAGPESVLEELTERRERLPKPEIVAGYLTALRHLAANEREDALRGLYEVEGLCSNEGEAGLRKLATAQSVTLAAVGRRSWTALWPVVLLHADASDSYARAGRFGLARFAATTASGLAASLAQESGDEAVARDASRLLAAMAGDALKRSAPAQAEILLADAVELDPRNPAALLTLATIHERGGRIQEAIELLERLTAAAPRHGEGSLRLAVNLLRGDRSQDGERLLAGLCRERAGWVGSVACEEWARLAVRRGSVELAEEILAAALERFGAGHFTLTVQRAYVLDRLGRSLEAEELLARVDLPAALSVSNERFHYNQWPLTVLAEGRKEVDERAEESIDELARILTLLPGAKPSGDGP